MSKSIIVLDTNILAVSPYLDSEEWQDIHGHADEWKLNFVVPEVVVMETVNVVRRGWYPPRQQLTGIEKWIRSLGKHEEFVSIASAAADRHDQYEEVIKGRIDELGIEIAALPSEIDHMDIARRASEGRAPYASIGKPEGGLTKDGYRDTLIWLTVLDVANRHPECDVWLVSNNYSDFGGKSEKKDPRDTQDYPLAWHTELEQELNRKGLTDRVFYARGLSRLEQHLLSKFAPLSDAERDELWESADRHEMDQMLVQALFAYSVDPRSAALPLDTTRATVTASVRKSDSLRFSEAAHRAAGAWTARFNCEIEATVEITNSTGDVAEESKPLVVIGRIDVSAGNRVTELTIEAIEAEADDPQRRAWARADAGAYAGLSTAHISSLLSGLKVDQPNFGAMVAGLKVDQPDFGAMVAGLKVDQPDFGAMFAGLKVNPAEIGAAIAGSVTGRSTDSGSESQHEPNEDNDDERRGQ